MDSRGRTTRRQLASRAIAVAGLGATGPTAASLLSTAQSEAADAPQSDAGLLGELLAVELLLSAVYEQVIRSALLSARGERVALKVLAQERTHAETLAIELRRLGGTAPATPAGASAIDKALADRHVSESLATLRTEHDCVSLLLDLESLAEGAYFKAISKLHDLRLLRVGAEIMANEAQHATLISEARRPGDISQSVPDAFVEGKH